MLPQKIFKFYHCRNVVSCILKLKTKKIAILDNLIETWYQYPPHKLVQTHACNTETFQMVFYGAQFFFCIFAMHYGEAKLHSQPVNLPGARPLRKPLNKKFVTIFSQH